MKIANIEKLTDKQKKIFKALVGIDSSLGAVYLGSVKVLADRSNLDRIPQSAHSIREIASLLSRKIDLPISEIEKEDEDQSHSQKLAKVFDPLGGVQSLDTVYKEWIKKNWWFIGVCHHGQKVSEKEYLSKLDEFENFLIDYVFKPQRFVMDEIDNVIKNGVEHVDLKKMKLLLSKNTVSYRFFFKQIDSSWCELLEENGFFSNPFSLIRDGKYISFPSWPASEYLVRIVEEKPDIVLRVIQKLTLGPDSNPRVMEDFIDVAKQMPISQRGVLLKYPPDKPHLLMQKSL